MLIRLTLKLIKMLVAILENDIMDNNIHCKLNELRIKFYAISDVLSNGTRLSVLTPEIKSTLKKTRQLIKKIRYCYDC